MSDKSPEDNYLTVNGEEWEITHATLNRIIEREGAMAPIARAFLELDDDVGGQMFPEIVEDVKSSYDNNRE